MTKLREEIQLKYKDVATDPGQGFHFHTGRPLAKMLAYPQAWVDALPEGAVESFAGVGNPFGIGLLPSGATVLDLGSGAGFDSLIAAQQVGPTGRVIGVDMTEEMLEKARENAQAMGLSNVEFKNGLAEELPLPDASVDRVISNGVINLVPDKDQAYREIYRVLKPGGVIQIADVVVQKEVPQDSKEDINLWTGWIAGSLLVEEYLEVIRRAGFIDFERGEMVDVFSGSPHESDAKDFDTRGMTFRARKPA